MGRIWPLNGPEQDKLSLAEVALLLGYEDADSVRRLVAEGKLPQPRGIGANRYYTGQDVAIILEMFGRWQPIERPAAKGGENLQKPAKGGEKQQNAES